MPTARNDTHDEVLADMFANDPEVTAEYVAMQPAYLVAREVIRTRGALGLSQADLARQMGTSQSVISRLENMDGSPNMKTVVALAEAMGRRVELRFVDPDAEVHVSTPPDWFYGDAEKYLEGISKEATEGVAALTDEVRRARAEVAKLREKYEPESVESDGAVAL